MYGPLYFVSNLICHTKSYINNNSWSATSQLYGIFVVGGFIHVHTYIKYDLGFQYIPNTYNEKFEYI